jgi:hypothetical protein
MNIPRPSPLKKVREFCVLCHGGHLKSVQFCSDTECALWFLRFGFYPASYVKARSPKYRELFDKKNFQKGGKFSPDIVVSEHKL